MMKTFATLLLIATTLLLASCDRAEGAAPEVERTPPPLAQVTVAPVELGTVTQKLELVGDLVARRRTVVVTEVDGIIDSVAQSHDETLALGLGQSVKKGDVLVQIDPKDYELAVASEEAGLAVAKSNLAVLRAWHRPEEVRRLRAVRDQAAARVELAALELARLEKLRGDKIVSESDLDHTKSAHIVAQAVLDSTEAALLVATAGPTPSEVARAEARIAEAEAKVAVAQDRLDRTTIRAPFDGVVTERYVDIGERVTAMPRVDIFEIMDLSRVFVEIGVPERHIHQVRLGDMVAVRTEGETEPLRGAVALVNTKIDRGSRTYRIRIGLVNKEGRLKAGQFVRATFDLRSEAEQPTVPTAAVTYGGGQPQVFVLDQDRVRARNVQLGLTETGRVQVLQGLTPGERVVIDDPAVLAPDMRVSVREEAAPAAELVR